MSPKVNFEISEKELSKSAQLKIKQLRRELAKKDKEIENLEKCNKSNLIEIDRLISVCEENSKAADFVDLMRELVK